MKIFPVVHYKDHQTALEEAAIMDSFEGVDGLFLISHTGEEEKVIASAMKIKLDYPHLKVGVNLLSADPNDVISRVASCGLDMAWFDDLGVTSKDIGIEAYSVSAYAKVAGIDVFCGVAFKYQKPELQPDVAARAARSVDLIPTTSGPATGKAPAVEKIQKMAGGPLAIASGMTPDNIATFAPYLTHVLVATGISKNFHQVDPEKLEAFIKNAKS